MKSCRMLRQLRVIAVLAALLAFLAPCSAKAAGNNYSSLVMDAESGEVLYAVNADTPRYPASLTKMMTLYVLFDALERGRTSLHDSIYISSHAASQPPSKIGLPAGSQISVENAILALVTKSANDIAAAIAEHLAGSEDAFAERMTARAHAIGMTNSQFRNASGLPDNEQMTTARDMAKLGHALIRTYPQYYPYFSTASFYYGGHSHPNHNRMLNSYDGVDGIKTGFINASGFNLVASAKRDQGRLIGVVFGARSSAQRARIMGTLLDSGFTALQTGVFPEVPADAVMTADASPGRGEQTADAASSVGAGWAIQVGQHNSRLSALQAGKRAADAVGAITPANLKVVEQRGRKGTTAYVTRFAGLTQAEAKAACRSLQSGGQPCETLRQGRAVIAAAGDGESGTRPAKPVGRIAVKSVGEARVAAKPATPMASIARKPPAAKAATVAEIGAIGGFEKAVRGAAASSRPGVTAAKPGGKNKAAKLSSATPVPIASATPSRSGKKTVNKGTVNKGAGGKALAQQNGARQPQS